MKNLIIALLLLSSKIILAQLPADFSDQLVLNNLEIPMGIVFDENGQGYIWEKRGLIHVIDTNGVKLPNPLLDIQEEAANWDDHGINCVALDPNFIENGLFYVAYVVERNFLLNRDQPNYDPNATFEKEATIGRVARWRADINTNFTSIITESRKVLLGKTPQTGIPILHVFHGVGTIIASEDGTLLISAGDGAPGFNFDGEGGDANNASAQAIEDQIISSDQLLHAFRAQYLGTFNGKVIRINAETGEGVTTNPFYQSAFPNSIQSKIWARGLRNPYRMCLRPETSGHIPEDGQPGTLIIGDVGEGSWEEINVSKNGGENFGWPIKEGSWFHFHYGYAENDLPNSLAPNPLFGAADCEQKFFDFHNLFTSAKPATNSFTFYNPCNDNVEIPAESFPSMETAPTIIWSNQRWNQPAKTLVPYSPNGETIQYIGTEEANSPIESEKFDGYSALAGVFYEGDVFPEIYKDKLFAYDFSGWIKVFDFDADQNLISVSPFHNAAEKIIHLSENAKDGCLYYLNTDGDLRKICFGGNPPPIAVAKANQFFGTSPLNVEFDASQSYDLFGLPIIEYQWDFGNGQTSDEIAPTFEFQTSNNLPAEFPVKLIVTDSLGAIGETVLSISLNNTPPSVEIKSLESGWKYALDESTPIELLAEVSDNEFDIEELTFEWKINFHHNVHAHPGKRINTKDAFFLIFNVGCEGDDYWYNVELSVTDPAGLTTTVHKIIFPDCDAAFVEFQDLTLVTRDENEVEFSFSTVSDENIERLEIQRSQDFLQFYPIGEVLPNSVQEYTFMDENPPIGTNVYRVKAISNDARFSYSDNSEVNFSGFPAIWIYPNPAGNLVNFYYENPNSNELPFKLYNAAGSLIYESVWLAEVGKPFSKAFYTTVLGNGVYYFQILDGKSNQSGQFIIAR